MCFFSTHSRTSSVIFTWGNTCFYSLFIIVFSLFSSILIGILIDLYIFLFISMRNILMMVIEDTRRLNRPESVLRTCCAHGDPTPARTVTWPSTQHLCFRQGDLAFNPDLWPQTSSALGQLPEKGERGVSGLVLLGLSMLTKTANSKLSSQPVS